MYCLWSIYLESCDDKNIFIYNIKINIGCCVFLLMFSLYNYLKNYLKDKILFNGLFLKHHDLKLIKFKEFLNLYSLIISIIGIIYLSLLLSIQNYRLVSIFRILIWIITTISINIIQITIISAINNKKRLIYTWPLIFIIFLLIIIFSMINIDFEKVVFLLYSIQCMVLGFIYTLNYILYVYNYFDISKKLKLIFILYSIVFIFYSILLLFQSILIFININISILFYILSFLLYFSGFFSCTIFLFWICNLENNYKDIENS